MRVKSVAVAGRLLLVMALLAITLPEAQAAEERDFGRMEVVHRFYGAMPTGVTVSQNGRIFVNYPRWGDKVPFTVGEIKNGREVAYPNREINRFSWDIYGQPQQRNHFVSVQSVVVDPKNRLWVLDTGAPLFSRTFYGGPKLVGIDLRTNRIFKTIVFPQDVALPTTYLNDVRFDLRRGAEGTAFITDSSGNGPNAIIVVDLATGKARRLLNDHLSVKAETKFIPIVEGRPMMTRKKGDFPKYVTIGSDGIAISADGERLFYCPLASRRLYSVSVDALANTAATAAEVARTVVDHGDKGASDGLESDAAGRIYVSNYEMNGILRRLPNGLLEPVVHDPRILWPDTLSVATDGYLYFTANQLHRQPNYHWGRDLRSKPYLLLRTKIDAGPVLLK